MHQVAGTRFVLGDAEKASDHGPSHLRRHLHCQRGPWVVVTVEEIATTEKNSASYVARVLRLTLRCWCGRLLWVGGEQVALGVF